MQRHSQNAMRQQIYIRPQSPVFGAIGILAGEIKKDHALAD